MHGLGNDFVLLDRPDIMPELLPELARQMCDRHFGIGADGLLVVEDSEIAEVRMRIFNSDGSEALMCGNGIRCIGKYIYESGETDLLCPTVETPAGLKKLHLHLSDCGIVESVTVDMGSASLTAPSDHHMELSTSHGPVSVIPVTIGNPHAIVVTEDLEAIDIRSLGSELEHHEAWPDRSNIEFVKIQSPGIVDQRTWERGVGETLACGTGACASAYALVECGKAAWPVSVRLSGGTLTVDSDPSSGPIMMTGKATRVFDGSFDFNI